MAAVLWTVSAADDLEDIANFLSRASGTYASTLVGSVLGAVGQLELLPAMGRVVPEYQNQSLRELIVLDYRIVYVHSPAGDFVRICGIVHGSRDIEAYLGSDPTERV